MNQEIEDLKKIVTGLVARVEQLEKQVSEYRTGFFNEDDDTDDNTVSPESRAKLEALMKELGM
ncbi:hypothetical protein [Jatrophihabitans sp.]|uniref:hypothetical protein n=1 Tax=Jatrophihabitans sp. TaxID=1932789 RepID=UPI0030C6C52B|nr:hypothetical protein [Jatrophihabitans sp.]